MLNMTKASAREVRRKPWASRLSWRASQYQYTARNMFSSSLRCIQFPYGKARDAGTLPRCMQRADSGDEVALLEIQTALARGECQPRKSFQQPRYCSLALQPRQRRSKAGVSPHSEAHMVADSSAIYVIDIGLSENFLVTVRRYQGNVNQLTFGDLDSSKLDRPHGSTYQSSHHALIS